MNSLPEQDALANQNFLAWFAQLQAFVQAAVHDGQAAHEVEKGLWQRLLQLGRHCMGQFFALQGDGDQGPTVTLPTGQQVHRLDDRHERRYVSIFGAFRLQRVVYGSREGQKIEFVPLDNRLDLPAGAFSYLLQDWDQSLCVEQAYGAARTTVERILGLRQSVDSLEHMNQEMAQDVTTFVLNRPAPTAEGDLLVLSADQKGVVMRRSAADPAPAAHRSKGEKASQKRMATVGTVYSVDRYVRTAAEVVAALFRDGPPPTAPRPVPQHKEVWASLPRDDEAGSSIAAVYAWMVGQLCLRAPPSSDRPLVFLSDGQEALWTARAEWLPARVVDILDLLHVTPRLWQAAHVFHRENSAAAETFVRQRLQRVLEGQAAGVIRGLREMATKHGLHGSRLRTLRTVCGYLAKNLPRMRYDVYLAAGYPIASGAVEGACRHLVKDRMERAGMHWTVPGAQAMLDMRSVYVSGHWEEYQSYRMEQESARLYPYRTLVAKSHNEAA